MFKKLKEKWNVTWLQFTLIFCTFAIGGSLCGRVGKFFLDKLQIENAWIYLPLYLFIITLLWPFSVLLVSIVFGQFNFFKNYLTKIGKRFFGKNN